MVHATSAEPLRQVRDAVEASLNEEAACPRHGKRMMESFMEAVSKDLAQINQLREQLNDDVSPSLCICLPLCICAAWCVELRWDASGRAKGAVS